MAIRIRVQRRKSMKVTDAISHVAGLSIPSISSITYLLRIVSRTLPRLKSRSVLSLNIRALHYGAESGELD